MDLLTYGHLQAELLDEYMEDQGPGRSHEPSDLVGFQDASFSWSSPSNGTKTPSKRRFVLKIEGHPSLTFVVEKFGLIVGPTGSGKTSLLMALLGSVFQKQCIQ
jgi:ABC-type multidrug transport system fused ATPase/permease subunit